MRIITSVVEVIALLAALLGLFQIYTAMAAPDASAIQQAAGIALGIGVGVIPYCIAGLFHRAVVRSALTARSDADDAAAWTAADR